MDLHGGGVIKSQVEMLLLAVGGLDGIPALLGSSEYYSWLYMGSDIMTHIKRLLILSLTYEVGTSLEVNPQRRKLKLTRSPFGYLLIQSRSSLGNTCLIPTLRVHAPPPHSPKYAWFGCNTLCETVAVYTSAASVLRSR